MELDMNKIINGATCLDDYEKDLFSSLFNRLNQKQIELFDDLQTKVMNQVEGARTENLKWRIRTALIDKEDVDKAKKNNMFEMLDLKPLSEKMTLFISDLHSKEAERKTIVIGGCFLRCSYSSLKEWFDRAYVASVRTEDGTFDIEYRIEYYGVFLNSEKEIERLARQYNVTIPSIFSPWSRRAALIKLDIADERFEKIKKADIDLQFESNGLLDIVEKGKTLIWNVDVVQEHEIPRPKENIDKEIVALFDNSFEILEFSVDENEYILINSPYVGIKRYKNCLYINTSDGITSSDLRYSKFIIKDVPISYWDNLEDGFENFYTKNRVKLDRIRTEADIAYALECFNNSIVSYVGFSRTLRDFKNIHIYEKRDAYYYTKGKALRSSSICYLHFKMQKSWMAEDYVSYILAFMNYFYPEFYWVGVFDGLYLE